MDKTRQYTDTYKDQFTPAEFEFDMSYDGLNMADKGHLIEHLAPLGCQYWINANIATGISNRIYCIYYAIEVASLNTK